MITEQIERKLAAILYADVAGYSRLTGEDEYETHRSLCESLDIITACVEQHQGKILHYAGDAVLVEFASVIMAMQSAVEIQQKLKVRNQGLPEETRLEFRIGINLGDVIVDREEIYGNGVNVAARLESIAQPGGICISSAVYDQVNNKMDCEFLQLGEQKFKNISEPVSAYAVLIEPGSSASIAEITRSKKVNTWRTHGYWALTILAILVIGLGLTLFQNGYFSQSTSKSDAESAGILPDRFSGKPAIIVLPFRNLSGDPAQEYFSDGITGDITTDLSKFHDLLVIGNSTAFTYKGKAVTVNEIRQDLGVRYVLEGSVQKAGKTVRINAQLIDATNGSTLWAERQDRDLNDLFMLQDKIVLAIVATLATEVNEAEQERAMQKETENLQAYDYLLRGREFLLRHTRAANAQAQIMFRNAAELDPGYGSAYTALGWCLYDRVLFGWTPFPSQALEQAYDFAHKALELNESDAGAHHLLGLVYLKWMQYDLAISELNMAIELNPGDPSSYDALGEARLYTGQPDTAIEALQTALRYNPKASLRNQINLGLAYYLEDRHQDAITVLNQALRRNPELVISHVVLAAVYAEAGLIDEAEREASNVMRLDPFFSIDSFGSQFSSADDRMAITEGLRRAGLE